MIRAFLQLAGFDLQRHLDTLQMRAEEFKVRTGHEVRQQVRNASITIGIAFLGLMFGSLTVLIGLLLLYLQVAVAHGPRVGLAVVGCITAALAAALVEVAVKWNGPTPSPLRVANGAGASTTTDSLRDTAAPKPSTAADSGTRGAANEAPAATDGALDMAVETIRNGSREALLATLAVAVVVGIVVGRQR